MMLNRTFGKRSATGRSGSILYGIRSWVAVSAIGWMLGLSCTAATAQNPPRPAILEGIGIDQRLNEQVPLDLRFTDENGKDVKLGEYFGTRPVILSLVYYQCPMLCTLVLRELSQTLQSVALNAGKDFQIVTVSINPKENSKDATEKKNLYLSMRGNRVPPEAWHFLTGTEDSIKSLADSVGFHYKFDPTSGQYAHSSGIMIATPDGHLSRYMLGVDYPPRDLRLSLVEASAGKIGSPVDQLLLFCYHYDPLTGKYGVAIMNATRAAGVATVLLIGGMILVLSRRERTHARSSHV